MSTGKKGSAPEVVDLLSSLTFASNETTMSLKNVRLHLRIFRRLSLAVENQAQPAYEGSALWYFDRNEELFGRRSAEAGLQESTRWLDAFQASLVDLSDLQVAAKNLHILLLRGTVLKLCGRQVTEHARALVLYTRVPQALLPRFPVYKPMLESFEDLEAFHKSWPAGLHPDGTAVDTSAVPAYPIFAQESLEKLVQEVLLPTLQGKRHNALMSGGPALAVQYVKDALPELERLYAVETAPAMAKTGNRRPAGETNDGGREEDDDSDVGVISEEEGAALLKEYKKATDTLLNTMAEDFVSRNVIFFNREMHGKSLAEKIGAQPMIQDGASRLWFFNAGLDCTRDPPRSMSPWRMKACVDEDQLRGLITNIFTLYRFKTRPASFHRQHRSHQSSLMLDLASDTIVLHHVICIIARPTYGWMH